MIEYLKTKKGYFYKLKKNGKNNNLSIFYFCANKNLKFLYFCQF